MLGIGNTLLSDEGVGVHVIRRLAEGHGDLSGVTYLDGGTLSFNLAGAIEDSDNLIVVDAAELDAPPGCVRTLVGEEMDRFIGRGKLASVHEVNLADLMDMVRLRDRLPSHRALVGIQPEHMGWGDEPTSVVAKALPEAVSQVIALVESWSGTGQVAP